MMVYHLVLQLSPSTPLAKYTSLRDRNLYLGVPRPHTMYPLVYGRCKHRQKGNTTLSFYYIITAIMNIIMHQAPMVWEQGANGVVILIVHNYLKTKLMFRNGKHPEVDTYLQPAF